jgi:hypothetical protein
MARSKATALKVARHLDIQERHLHISLSTVVCHNRDLRQPDQWLTSSLQPNMGLNKAATVVPHNNRQLDTEANLWATEVQLLPAPVAMAEASQVPTHSGISQLPNLSEMGFKAIKAST